MFKFLVSLGLFCVATSLYAQPSNDDCAGAIPLPTTTGTNLCSAVGQYTNVNATPSGYGGATCFSSASNDVWFTFTSAGTDITITINGNQPPAAGGTLQSPQVALYLVPACGGVINQIGCAAASGGNNIVDLYKGGLIIGQTYYIRVQGQGSNTGSFQICLNNYNAPAAPGSDCPTASVLCDKSPFVVQSVTSAGNNPDEAAGTCLGGLGGNSESNSTWFKWTCDVSGTLTMTLTPNNPSDDLDFVIYELPGGLNDCAGKHWIRCMAAGDFNYPSTCMGPTGLRTSSNDVSENSGCTGNNDNWISPINMVSGRSYALLVNNFSATGNGFSVSWGGTGTFQGPHADFTANPIRLCAGETVNLQDASSFSFGTITNRYWTFGTGATPATANTVGPHNIRYTSPGNKSIALTIQTDKGCVVTHIAQVQVDSCCQTVNAIQHTNAHTDVVCRGTNTGTASVTVPSGNLPIVYRWSNGGASNQINNLAGGYYAVTISNGICNVIDSILVGAPPAWNVQASITRPSCAGGTDGAVDLLTTSGSNGSPYSFNWNNTSFGSTTFIHNLANGVYTLRVRDRLNCDTFITYNVHELILEIDSVQSIIRNPSCFQFSNGEINLFLANGLGPYQFQWATGETTSFLDSLPQGSYTLSQIQDANLCVGGPFIFNLVQPPLLVVAVDSQEVSCFGTQDGYAVAHVSGGTPPYSYHWSNGDLDSLAENLRPNRFPYHYEVEVRDSQNCLTIGTATIIEPPKLVIDRLYPTRTLCYGYSDGTVTVDASGGRTDANGYEITIVPRTQFGTSVLFDSLKSGNYAVMVTDTAGCSVTDTVFVPQPAQLIVDAGLDRIVELGDTFQLHAIPTYIDFYNYQWTNNQKGEIYCDTCRKTGVFPYNNDTYIIRIEDDKGCFAIDSMHVRMVKNYNVFIPNAFTPNQDGINDFLKVFGNKTVRQVNSYRVFSRWGELMYYMKNIPIEWTNTGWDGTYKGEMVNSGVYVYVIEVEYWDGKVELFGGDVTVIR